jgi:hypothetical protein
MKRFAVLFGMLAIVACGSAYATAPQVRDMPDVHLAITGSASGLPLLATDAYDVMDYVKDVDSAPTELTVSILNVQMIAAPNAGSPAGGSPSTIDINGATQVSGATNVYVDIYGRANYGWQQYTVRVDDASTYSPKGGVSADAISDDAVVKYATFVVEEPTIEDGVFLKTDGETSTTRQFVYIWLCCQATGELYRLDVAVSPAAATPLNWSVWVSDIIQDNSNGKNLDANGLWLGLEKKHAANGTSCSAGGINYEIDVNGMLTLTSGGSVSPGPWLVGLLGESPGDPNEANGSRIMVAHCMVAEASPDTGTCGTSTTFNDLSPQVISAATDRYVNTTACPNKGKIGFVGEVAPTTPANIVTNCAWEYIMAGADTTLDSVDLEIVDLGGDGDLPAAAQIWASTTAEDPKTAHIAGGNGLKATLTVPAAGQVGARGVDPAKIQLDAFRLGSRAFKNITSPTDVVTFSLSIATDAGNATDLPKYQMWCGSGFAGCLVGKDIRSLKSMLQLMDGASYTRPQTDIPTAAQGWHKLACTYGAGATLQWFNVDGDTDFDSDDLDILAAAVAGEGWDGHNELGVVKCGFVCSTQKLAENDVTVWLDNLCVYRSAYAIDLALGNESLVDSLESGDDSTYDTMVSNSYGVEYTSDIDGTIESAAPACGALPSSITDAQLKDIGLYDGWGGGNGPAFKHPDMDFLNADLACVNIGAYDITNNNNSCKSLKLTLAGDDGADGCAGALDSMRLQLSTGAVAGSGDGLYAIEAYVAKLNACNMVNSYRHPNVRIIIQEVAPNYFGAAAGYIYTLGGLPTTVSDGAPDGWHRAVADLYIPNCDILRGLIQVLDTFKADAANFAVPVFVDDLKLYKVDDPAIYFDADLFDGI